MLEGPGRTRDQVPIATEADFFFFVFFFWGGGGGRANSTFSTIGSFLGTLKKGSAFGILPGVWVWMRRAAPSRSGAWRGGAGEEQKRRQGRGSNPVPYTAMLWLALSADPCLCCAAAASDARNGTATSIATLSCGCNLN